MNVENYICSINGRKITFDDFLLELRKQYRTERAYLGAKEKLYNEMKQEHCDWNSTSKIHLRISRKRKICPICRNEIKGYPSLSRKDNKIEICSNCGTLEALETLIQYQEGEKNGKNKSFNSRANRRT